MIQFLIMILSVGAVFMITHKNIKVQTYSSIPGILGQPLWIYETFTNEQWGMFALSLFYFYSWLQHGHRNLIKSGILFNLIASIFKSRINSRKKL